jgi:hypothetical protein
MQIVDFLAAMTTNCSPSLKHPKENSAKSFSIDAERLIACLGSENSPHCSLCE